MKLANKTSLIFLVLITIMILLSFAILFNNFCFAENEYTITYSYENEQQLSYKTIDVDYTIQSAIFKKDGHKQIGWSTNEDGSTIDYNFGATYTLNQDITLYPCWEKYQFEFNIDACNLDLETKFTETLSITTTITNPVIEYFSEDENIATVDSSGVITPVNKGATKIFAKETTTNSICSCEVNVADFNINIGDEIFKAKVDGIYEYIFIASLNTTVDEVVTKIKEILAVDREYVIKNENITSTSILQDVSNDLIVDFLYDIEIVQGTIKFNLDKSKASREEIVNLINISTPANIKLGKISVLTESGNEVEISQTNKSFVMPNENVKVYINVKSIELQTNAGNVLLEGAYIGASPILSISKEKISDSLYNEFSIPNQSEIACYYKVVSNLTNLENDAKIVIEIPEEIEGKDGIIVGMMVDGKYVEEAIAIENNKLIFNTNNCVDFVILVKSHEEVTTLVGTIIFLSFLNAFAFVVIILLTMKYIDNKQNPQRYKIKAYSSIIPAMFLVAAARASQIAGVVLLSLLFMIQLIVIIYLFVKLTEEGGILTTSKDYKHIKY